MTRSDVPAGEATPPNRGAPNADLREARARVLHVQTKLRQWAKLDPNQRFDDLLNLVCDPATLAVAWDRVKSNGGSQTAGVDGVTKYNIEHRRGAEAFLREIRDALKARTFRP